MKTEHELKSNETSSRFSTFLPSSNKMVDSIMKSELKGKKFILITQIWGNAAIPMQICTWWKTRELRDNRIIVCKLYYAYIIMLFCLMHTLCDMIFGHRVELLKQSCISKEVSRNGGVASNFCYQYNKVFSPLIHTSLWYLPFYH